MNAAETSASSAIADWTPLTVVSRSSTTAEIDTFISDVSTTSTNIAIASRMATRRLPVPSREPRGWPSVTRRRRPARTSPHHVDRPFAASLRFRRHGRRARVGPPHPAGGGSTSTLDRAVPPELRHRACHLGGFGTGVHTELAVDDPEVELQGVDRDVELVGDLADGQPAGQEAQDVPFAIGERLDQVGAGGRLEVPCLRRESSQAVEPLRPGRATRPARPGR